MNDKYFTEPKIKDTNSDIRREDAWNAARAASHILKEKFGAFRVVLFGSLARPSDFTQWSDIDIAAWGIPADKFYRAVADVTGFSKEFDINLTDVDTCPPKLLKAVEKEGIDL